MLEQRSQYAWIDSLVARKCFQHLALPPFCGLFALTVSALGGALVLPTAAQQFAQPSQL